ncbi:unnamed protein product [Pieris macdunnoughi]|uniref:C2H2-type domain-containing protein n=1 Tax=Pieris macdunnoughi TaxID=345717 RepID=A0A821LH07_9NEOP|nr:unnamed protein product [Pieris macdunnoughi]
MYECPFCSVAVANNQLIAHSRTTRHKLLCKQDSGDYFTYIIDSAFQCRIVSYRINGLSTLLDPKLYLAGASGNVQQLLTLELKTYKHIKTNFELFCTYVMFVMDVDKRKEEVVRDLKSFNTKNVTLDLSSNLCSFYEEICSQMLRKCEEFQEKDSGWALEKIEFLEVNVNKHSYNRKLLYTTSCLDTT